MGASVGLGARAWVALCVTVGLLASAGVGGAGAVAADAGSGDGIGSENGIESVGAGGATVPATAIEADQVVIDVDLHPNGTATWSVAYRIRLRTENDTAAFEELQRDIAANGSRYVSRFAAGIEGTVADAENRTGREMNASGFTVRTDRRQLPREYGVVTYRFRWAGFAAVDGERLVVSEVLSGFFLDASTRLSVAWPAGYRPVEVAPDPDERRERGVVWVGPLDFPAGTPRVAVAPATTAAGGSGGDGGEDGAPSGGGGVGVPLPMLAAALVLVAAAAATAAYRRFRDPASGVDSPGEGSAAAPAGTAPAGTGGGASGEDVPADGASIEELPPELLSNEEQVLRFLASEGGRAKQQDVVSALDWTEARTSQVVNEMEEEGEIEKFRIGRENVLKLPEEGEGGADAEGSDRT